MSLTDCQSLRLLCGSASSDENDLTNELLVPVEKARVSAELPENPARAPGTQQGCGRLSHKHTRVVQVSSPPGLLRCAHLRCPGRITPPGCLIYVLCR